MYLDQMWKVSYATADVHRGSRIRYMNRTEDGPNAFVGLKLLRYTHNDQSASVERLGVFRGAEELSAKADHGSPVEPNDDYNNPCDDVHHADMGPEDITTNVADGKHGKHVPFRLVDVFEIVCDIDRDKYGAGSQGY